MNLTVSICKKKFNYSILLNFFIVIYAFFLPFSKAGVTVSAGILLIICIFEGNFRTKYYKLKQNKFIIAVLLFILLNATSLLWTENLDFAIDYVRKYWHFLTLPIIYMSIKKEYFEKVFTSFIFGSLISVIVAFYSGNFSPFMDHTNHGVYLAFAIFVSIYKFFSTKDMKLKIAYCIFTLVFLLNLFLITGRTGQVAFFLSIILIVFLNSKSKIKAVLISGVTICLIFITAYIFSPNFEKRIHAAKTDVEMMLLEKEYKTSLGMRFSLWVTGTKVFLENPLSGTGIGGELNPSLKYLEEFKIPKELVSKSNIYLDFHNSFIQYSVQFGIFGLILTLSLFFFLFRLRLTKKLMLLNYSFVFLFILLSVGGLSLHIMVSMVLFALFGGLFSGISRLENEKIT